MVKPPNLARRPIPFPLLKLFFQDCIEKRMQASLAGQAATKARQKGKTERQTGLSRRPAAQCIKPSSCELGFAMGRLAVSYFHMANATLSSALRRFTVL
ncbi:hypothetical protein, partial [Chromobacterium alkanivorans]|uniref:hypothetical protein n=1 Tax=Chromobacterium alkanivorans TaxID=1071719 RepID=UPI0021697B4B